MVEDLHFIVYTLEFCPNCERLKACLTSKGCSYEEQDMSTAEALTELRMNGVFVTEAPVLRLRDDFYTSADLFGGGLVLEDVIDGIAAGE
ncbi:MAG: hypothetical protein PWP08_787 [Methanofollis sp.]|nr:hypothetical protein [Methanofollis sp.]